jgi:hypothetical protein
VVRRLVEHEHVGPPDEQPPERRTDAPAAGELARVALRVAGREAEAGERALDVAVERVAAELLVALADVGVAVHQRRRALHVRGLELAAPSPRAPSSATRWSAPSRTRSSSVGCGREVGRVLLEPADAEVARAVDLTGAGRRPPTSVRSSVVLPTPFPPTSATRSPTATPRSTSSRSTRPPTSMVRPDARSTASAVQVGRVRRARSGASVRRSGACASARRSRRSRPSRGTRPTGAATPRRRAGGDDRSEQPDAARSVRALDRDDRGPDRVTDEREPVVHRRGSRAS